MRKRSLLLFLCLCLVAIITSACGGGGKTTSSNNSAYYYLLAQQNTINDQPSAPDPSQTPENPFANAKVGDFVEFGRYPQTAEGEILPIEWQVLYKDEANNLMLVISHYGLDAKSFNKMSTNNYYNSWDLSVEFANGLIMIFII